jgi:hypothetical protein
MKLQTIFILAIVYVGVIVFGTIIFSGPFDLSTDDGNLMGKATAVKISMVKEDVKCVFANSKNTESCYSEYGSCKGIGTCVATIYAHKNKKLTWKSSCGGYAYTVVDGKSESAQFKCPEVSVVKEQVKCSFSGANPQQCYSDKGSCKASALPCACPKTKELNLTNNSVPCVCPIPTSVSCTVDVSGNKGENITWKSSCGGYVTTIIDGENEYAKFNCENAIVTEEVTCSFPSSAGAKQECASSKGSCIAVIPPCNISNSSCFMPEYISCNVKVSGVKGEQVTWKSTCGGYASTTIDGQSEYAKFNCLNSSTPINTSSNISITPVCGSCNVSALPVDWCANGTIINGPVDSCGCRSTPICRNY